MPCSLIPAGITPALIRGSVPVSPHLSSTHFHPHQILPRYGRYHPPWPQLHLIGLIWGKLQNIKLLVSASSGQIAARSTTAFEVEADSRAVTRRGAGPEASSSLRKQLQLPLRPKWTLKTRTSSSLAVVELLTLAFHLNPNSLNQCYETWVIAKRGEDLIV